jgi:hypothetical protein
MLSEKASGISEVRILLIDYLRLAFSILMIIAVCIYAVDWFIRDRKQRYHHLHPLEHTDEESLVFSGDITDTLKEEIRLLYCRQYLFLKVFFVVVAVVMIAVAILLGSIPAIRGLSWDSEIYLIRLYQFICIVFALGCLMLAFGVTQIWWRWWWPRYTALFGTHVSGEITQTGMRLSPGAPLILWSSFGAVKMNPTLVLLYLSKAFAYPVHRSMFTTESDWTEFTGLVEKHVRSVMKCE